MIFQYKIIASKKNCLISLEGNLLEKATATGLLDEINHHIAEGQKNFVIDLSQLQHINSNGLNVLINILTKSRNAGGDAVISDVSEKIKSLLIMTKLNTVFTITGNGKLAKPAMKTVS